jgi:hypothetical protein
MKSKGILFFGGCESSDQGPTFAAIVPFMTAIPLPEELPRAEVCLRIAFDAAHRNDVLGLSWREDLPIAFGLPLA